MSDWSEQRRADRQADAAIRREDAAAAVQRRIAERAAERREARKEADAREARRTAARDQRRARWKQRREALTAWVRTQAEGLLWLVIMGVPMTLAWSSMAAFGTEVYGLIGVGLPLFSEGATLVFARAIPRAIRAGQPVTLLRLGLVVFGAVQAVLNFVHGVSGSTVDGRAVPGSVGHGVVMALVSLGGVTVHQIMHGRQPRPRRTREQRRTARKLARVRKVAIRQAVTEVDEAGQATVVHRPGRFTLTRDGWRHGFRLRLTEAIPAAPTPAPGFEPGTDLADEVAAWLAEQPGPGTGSDPAGTAQTHPGTTPGTGGGRDHRVPEYVARIRAAIAAGELKPNPSRRAVQRFLGVRTQIAGLVVKALRGEGPAGVPVA